MHCLMAAEGPWYELRQINIADLGKIGQPLLFVIGVCGRVVGHGLAPLIWRGEDVTAVGGTYTPSGGNGHP